MRKRILILGLAALAAGAFPAYASPYAVGYVPEANRASAAGHLGYGADLDIGYCYNYLAPYGSWVRMDPYGYVWCPRRMSYHWRPYSEGRWVWTDYGWTWISDESWGWITFHYGRWGWDNDFGWFWVPGTTWGPAWVSWRYNDQYCGWAPLPPGFQFRAGIGFGSVSVNIPGRFWIFVQASHFLDHDVHSRLLPYERNATIINHTSVHNNIYVRDNRIINEGIGVAEVQHFTKREVPRYSLQNSGRPGQAQVSGHDVRIYRPAIREDAAARPSAFLSEKNARQELAPARVYEPRQQSQPPAQARNELSKRQAEERSRLQKSQSHELRQMERKQAEAVKHARNSAEKAKVQREYQSRVSEMQKSHQAEQQRMAEHHKRETEQLRQAHSGNQRKPSEQAGKREQGGREQMAKSGDHHH